MMQGATYNGRVLPHREATSDRQDGGTNGKMLTTAGRRWKQNQKNNPLSSHLGDADPSSAQEDHRRPIFLVNLAEL